MVRSCVYKVNSIRLCNDFSILAVMLKILADGKHDSFVI